jgi:hypothetical protein
LKKLQVLAIPHLILLHVHAHDLLLCILVVVCFPVGCSLLGGTEEL